MVILELRLRLPKSASHLALSTLLSLQGFALSPRLNAQPQNTPAVPGTQVQLVTTAKPEIDTNLPPEELGDIYMQHKRYQAAIEAYRRAPQDSANVWNKLGIANQQMLIEAEARKDYEQSLRIQPQNPEVLNNLATIFYTMKQYSNAEKLYRKALKIAPKSAVIYKNLGTAYLAEHKVKKGWEYYQQALALDPQIFEGVSHFHVGDPTNSQQMGAMNYFMAKSFLMQGHLDKAIDYLRLDIDEGFTDGKKILEDKEFAVLRDSPAFQLLLSERGQRAVIKD